MEIARKYTDEQYVDFEYWSGDEEHSHNEQKIVTTRKEQECVSVFADPHPIPAGSRVIRERAIHVDEGWQSCYLCLDHADEYLDEMYGE